jgi:hypothetical protein
LHSAIVQLAGSWHGYLYEPSYPQLVNDTINSPDRAIVINFLI